MATLVLTTVGTALGGPIGGALGALAGNALDRQLFAPKGRDGARLSDLRVQMSSYGTPIPQIFGTMRVAGTVIWATDLIETRATSRAGKGRPGVTSYSYSANLAVLLAARPIEGVGRIWADGQLVRGAAGDWKVDTAFRLHLGDERQDPDPLIASAEAAGSVPAHRGCAYAVFEGLQLAGFGNRIPSLSFEVIADAGTVSAGAVARGLASELGSGGAALALDGYAAAGGSVRDALELLAEAGGAWWRPVAGSLAMHDVAGSTTTIAADPARDGREVAAADRAPAEVSVRHFDPTRDWQAGLQRARRPGGGPARTIELPASLSAAAAKGVATAALARSDRARVRRTLGAQLGALALSPGNAVTISDEAGIWRVEAVTLEGWTTTLTLVPLTPAPQPAMASPGRALPAPDLLIGATILHAVELPALEDALLGQPRLLVWATGEGGGWRRAALLLSLNGGASWTEAGGTATPATVGLVEMPPGPATAALIDRRTTLTVQLARTDMVLADADPRALDAGANLALVGDELLQFGRAEPLGAGRWRLRDLWRGRRGTDGTAAAIAGDRFVLVEADTARAIDLPLSALGGTARIMASGVGGAEPAAVIAEVTGASVAPPAPVGLRREGDGVRWTRRSRAGWRWLDRVDAPLAEERERYRVTVRSNGASREVEVEAAFVALTADELAGATVTVRQRGSLAESPGVTLTF